MSAAFSLPPTPATPAVPPAPLVSVVVPAHNEEAYLEEALTAIVEGMRVRHLAGEVVVVENGSTDRTVGVARRAAAGRPEIRVLQLRRPDYGAALRAGFRAARGELVANFDVDLVDLAFLDRALDRLGADPSLDVVIGTKRGAGADDRRTAGRRLVTGAFSLVMRYGFGLRVSDTHGLKLLRADPLRPLVDRVRSSRDLFDTELVLRAERAGLRLAEIPVTVEEQRPPRTPIVRRVPRTLAGLAGLRLRLWQADRRVGERSAGDDAVTGRPAGGGPVASGR